MVPICKYTVYRNPTLALRLGGFAQLANNCILISVPLCTLLYVGGHLTILIDETTLNSNSEAMGQVLSSTEIIRQLRHHITSVRYFWLFMRLDELVSSGQVEVSLSFR